jgi:GNAT superfamily N-acetyltransferase
MAVSITPVQGVDDRETFLRVPYQVYADDPDYVHPLLSDQRAFLDPAENPFFRHAEASLWVARRDGRPVGRIAACVDRAHNEAHDERTGFFGFYEAPPDGAVAAPLLAVAAAWLKERGAEQMRGPGCFTTNHDNLGLFIEGDPGPPVIGMPYNQPYYPEQLEAFGLARAKDLFAWQIKAENLEIPAKIRRIIDSLLRSDSFTVRPFDMRRFDEEARTVRDLYNRCWNSNWGFIPMDEEEFAFAARDMRKMVDADFLLMAEAKGQPIGFCLTIPDFNRALRACRGRLWPLGWLKFLLARRRIDYARTLLLGVLPEYRHRGVDVVMVYRTFQAGFARGYRAGECSWVLEDNSAMNRILGGLGARVYRRYRIYEKPLS